MSSKAIRAICVLKSDARMAPNSYVSDVCQDNDHLQLSRVIDLKRRQTHTKRNKTNNPKQTLSGVPRYQ